MLGAEGVKSLVIARLAEVVPKSLDIRRHVVGADAVELPDVAAYYPEPEVEINSGPWPFVTVHVDDTPGEISNQAPPAGSTELVQEFQLEYNLIVGVNTWSAGAGQSAALAARLQAERIALACREALLQNRTLLTARGEYADWAEVNYARWVEDYGVYSEPQAGAWIGQAALKVPVLAHEYLDRSPYLDTNLYVISALEVYGQDPVTGAVIPETVSDRIDGGPEPKPTD